MRRGFGYNRIRSAVAMLVLPCICLLLFGAPGLARVLHENRTLVISGDEATSPWHFLENCEDVEAAEFPYASTQEAMLSVLAEGTVAEDGDETGDETGNETDGNAGDGSQMPDGDGNETPGDGEAPNGENPDGGQIPSDENPDGDGTDGGETLDGENPDGGETPDGGENPDDGETPDGENPDGGETPDGDGNQGDVTDPSTGKELELLYVDDEVVVLAIAWPAESDALYLFGGAGAWEKGMRYSTDGYQGYCLSESGAIELEAGARVVFLERPHNTDSILGIFHDDEMAQAVSTISFAEATKGSWSFALTAGNRVLGEDGKAVWTCSGVLSDGRLQVERQVLGAAGFEAFDEEEILPMTETRAESKTQYAIANPKEHLAPAGTYRLLVTQFVTLADGTEVALMQMELSYFVNYR